METIKIDQLKDELTFTGDLFIDSNFLVLPHTAQVTEDLIKALKEWDFNEFNCTGGISLGGDIGLSNNGNDEKSGPAAKIGQSVIEAFENSKKAFTGNNDKARMAVIEGVYNEYMNYINSLFTRYVTHNEIDLNELSDTVKELCVFIKDNKRFMLRINPDTEHKEHNFIVIHAMRSTVLSLAIGLQLHLSISKLIELGMATIIHEIGMVRLPPQLYMTDRKLSGGEKAQIYTHPVLGYEIAKNMQCPMSIQLAVLEHHEKENGTGYPRQLTGDKISSYAKIIAVACAFEAITSNRSYKEGRPLFDAILELLKNEGHPYDDQIIKALLYTVSLYPIGTYVFLKNGKCAVVVDVNQDNPRLPIVQMLTETEKDGTPKLVQTNTDSCAIIRVLNQKETKDVVNSIKQAEELKAKKEAEKKALEPETSSQEAENQAPEQTNKIILEPPSPAVSVEPPKVNKDGEEEIDISMFE
ncbi:MAG: HD-GYP domain-containing protein [Treponema sp.]|nr:HD-GYP domain-containing protein [Treponema sp.]